MGRSSAREKQGHEAGQWLVQRRQKGVVTVDGEHMHQLRNPGMMIIL